MHNLQTLHNSIIRDKRFPYFLLGAVGLLVYFNSFFNYFLWDDELLIIRNGYIKSWANIFKIFLVDIYHWNTSSNFYRPLLSLSLMSDFYFWKLNPFGYHLTNFLLHLFNACIIFYLINLLTNNKTVSLIAALLFIIHPVHTEAVTYVSGRADPLVVLFILFSFLFFLKSLSPKKAIVAPYYLFSVFFFICSLLSKEIALILPILLILYDYLFNLKSPHFVPIIQNLRKHLLFLIIALIYIALRINFLPFSSEGAVPYSLLLRIINLPSVFLFYIYTLLLPFNLRVERFLPLVEKANFLFFLSAILLTIIFFGVAKSYKRSKIAYYFSLWFFINLFVMANIIRPLNAVVSEHWLYLPSIGFFYIAAVGIDKFLKKETSFWLWQPTQKFKRTLLIIIVVTFSLLTISRNFEWKSPLTLFESTLQASKGSFSIRDIRVRYNLAGVYAQRGLLDKAIEEYKKVLAQKPNLEKVHYSLGLTYARKGLNQEAEAEFLEAITLDPDYLLPYYALGLLYLKLQAPGKAEGVWDKMLKIKPLYPQDSLLLKRAASLRERIQKGELQLKDNVFPE